MIKIISTLIVARLPRRVAAVMVCLVAAVAALRAQPPERLTLEACYRLAEKNYPLISQYALIEKTREYSVASVSRGYLPRIGLGGQATHQSDVTKVPFSLPGMDIPTLSRDQYSLYGEVSQPVSDLFTTEKYEIKQVEASSAIERQKVAVALYQLKDRINQLYFGILLADARIAQSEILRKDLQAGMDKDSVAIAGGVALKSSADILRAEWLKAGQQMSSLRAMRKGYADMLSFFIHRTVDTATVLERPVPVPLTAGIRRPELQLFNEQKHLLELQDRLLTAGVRPHLSLFARGGYGRPGLNMLDNDFAFYYIGGVRLSWNLSGFYTLKWKRHLLSAAQSSLDLEKETFLFNTNLSVSRESSKISELKSLMEADREIVRLRENIRRAAEAQLRFGAATANDYITYVHAVDEARQSLVLHELQLLMTRYDYKTTTGN